LEGVFRVGRGGRGGFGGGRRMGGREEDFEAGADDRPFRKLPEVGLGALDMGREVVAELVDLVDKAGDDESGHEKDDESEGREDRGDGAHLGEAAGPEPIDNRLEEEGEDCRHRKGDEDGLEVGEDFSSEPDQSDDDGSEGDEGEAGDGAPEGALLGRGWKAARHAGALGGRRIGGGGGLFSDRVEHAVHEAGGVAGSEGAGQLDGFVDGDRGRDLGHVEQLVGGEAKDGAIDAVEALGPVVLDGGVDPAVDFREVPGEGGEAVADFAGEGGDVGLGSCDAAEFGSAAGGGGEGGGGALDERSEVCAGGEGVALQGLAVGERRLGGAETAGGAVGLTILGAAGFEDGRQAAGGVALEFAPELIEGFVEPVFVAEEVLQLGCDAAVGGGLQAREAPREGIERGSGLRAALLEVEQGAGAGLGLPCAKRFEEEIEHLFVERAAGE